MTLIKVLLDTNALWMRKKLRQKMISACQQGRLRVYLPALVLVERERQLIQRDYWRAAEGKPTQLGRSVRFFRQWVGQLAFDLQAGKHTYSPILDFDFAQAQAVSESWGTWLAEQEKDYLLMSLDADGISQELRRRFKNRRSSLADLDWMMHKADWSIAAVARHTGWLIVTDDQDAPFWQSGVHVVTIDEFAGRYLEDE